MKRGMQREQKKYPSTITSETTWTEIADGYRIGCNAPLLNNERTN